MSHSPRPVAQGSWWLVLGLVGLDYFSTLAYLPSIIIEAAGPLAPLAALFMVVVTLLLALPVYAYVVGRSPHGQGATGLLERSVPGWRGKLVMLVLMGFVAADFVLTRSLSVADASTHVLANPHWDEVVDRFVPGDALVEGWLGAKLWYWLAPWWTRQMGLTIGLAILSFAFLWLLHGGFTRNVLRLAALVTVVYLIVAGIIIASGLVYLDYFTAMVDDKGLMKRDLADDGLHPNPAGFKIMAPLAEATRRYDNRRHRAEPAPRR